MKIFASLVLTVALLATMLSAFAVPAFADAAEVAEIVEAEAVVENPDPKANQSESDRQAQEDCNALKNAGQTEDGEGSTLSEGSLTIIVGVAAAVVFGLGGFFVGKAAGKKNKPATAGGENTDEE